MNLVTALVAGWIGAFSSILTLAVTEYFRHQREADGRKAKREDRLEERARGAENELRSAYASWTSAMGQMCTNHINIYNSIAHSIRAEDVVKASPDTIGLSALEHSRELVSQLTKLLQAGDKRVRYLTNKLLLLETDGDRRAKIRAVAETDSDPSMKRPVFNTPQEAEEARDAALKFHKTIVTAVGRIIDDIASHS